MVIPQLQHPVLQRFTASWLPRNKLIFPPCSMCCILLFIPCITFSKSGFGRPLQNVISMLFMKFRTNSLRSINTKIHTQSHCLIILITCPFLYFIQFIKKILNILYMGWNLQGWTSKGPKPLGVKLERQWLRVWIFVSVDLATRTKLPEYPVHENNDL